MKSYLEVIEQHKTVPTHEGGAAYAVGPFVQLRRFLIMGATGTFYVKQRPHVEQFKAVIEECLRQDPLKTIAEIEAVSDGGLAVRNEPAIFALAVAAAWSDPKTRAMANALVPTVCRTGTHLIHWVQYVQSMRGWGRSLKTVIRRWVNAKTPEQLAYQAVKYKSRDGMALADVLRLGHPKPRSAEHSAVMKYIVDGAYPIDMPSIPNVIAGEAALKMGEPDFDPVAAARIIRHTRLPREAIPTHMLTSREVWEALLPDMGLTALIRNLPTMTRVGLLDRTGAATAEVLTRLVDPVALKKARIHPMAVLVAMKTYAEGHGYRSQGTWTPVPIIVDALDAAFYATIPNVEPANVPLVLGIDCSASMMVAATDSNLTAAEVAAAMAMIAVRTERDVRVVSYDDKLIEVPLSSRQRLDDVLRLTNRQGGWTHSWLVPEYVHQSPEPCGGLVLYTDSETADRQTYPTLRKARGKHGPIRAACVGITANDISLFPEGDALCMGVAGFDPSMLPVLSQFLQGAI